MAPPKLKIRFPTSIEREDAVVDDVAHDAAGGAAIADLQRAAADGGNARVGVRAGENENAGTTLRHAVRARKDR